MVELNISVPDVIITILVNPIRLRLSSKTEVAEVTTTETLEGLLSANGIAYAVKGVESVPYELDFLFNSLYGGNQLRTIASALKEILFQKGLSVEVS